MNLGGGRTQAADVTRVGLLAPMRQELAPLVRRLRLRRAEADTALYVGLAGRVEVVAALTGIGMQAAAAATGRLLDATKLDHVLVVGIAGGVDADQRIGSLIAPEVVVDGTTGREFRPVQLGSCRRAAARDLGPARHRSRGGGELKQSGVVGSTWRRPRSRPCANDAAAPGRFFAPSATASPTGRPIRPCSRSRARTAVATPAPSRVICSRDPGASCDSRGSGSARCAQPTRPPLPPSRRAVGWSRAAGVRTGTFLTC